MKSLVILTLLFFSVALLPRGLPAAGWLWESLNALGLTAMVLLAVLAWEAQTPARPQALRMHQTLAIVATLLVGLHAVGFLVADAVLLEHLKPTAPWSMLSALVALLLLLILCVASFPRLRRGLWKSFESFRQWHLGLSLATLALILWHVLGTASVFTTPWKIAALIVLMAGVPLSGIVLRRRGGIPMFLKGQQGSLDPLGFAAFLGGAALVLSGLYGWIKQS